MKNNNVIELLNNCIKNAGKDTSKIYFYNDILDKNILDNFIRIISLMQFNDMLVFISEKISDYHDEKLANYLHTETLKDIYKCFKSNNKLKTQLLNLFLEALDSENRIEYANAEYFYNHIDEIGDYLQLYNENLKDKNYLFEKYETDSDFHKLIDGYVYKYIQNMQKINEYDKTNKDCTYKINSTINEYIYNLVFNTKKILDVEYGDISRKMICDFLLCERKLKNKEDILLFFLSKFDLNLSERNDIIYCFLLLNCFSNLILKEIYTKSYLYLKDNFENKNLFLKLHYLIKASSKCLKFSEDELDTLFDIYLYSSLTENYTKEDIKVLTRVNPLLPLSLFERG